MGTGARSSATGIQAALDLEKPDRHRAVDLHLEALLGTWGRYGSGRSSYLQGSKGGSPDIATEGVYDFSVCRNGKSVGSSQVI